MRKGGLEDLPFISVVAPATRPLAIAYLLATQRTTRARCEGLGVSDTAKLQLFHKSARLCAFFLCPFSLMRRDRRIKADIKGPTHKAGAPPPCRPWPTRPAQSVFGIPAHGGLSSHVIPTWDCAMAWDLWLRLIAFDCFSVLYPTANDNKRLQSTTNVCSTA